MSPGTGRVFSSELLLLSPRGHLVLAYTVSAGGVGGEGGREESPGGSPEGKYLELRRVVGLGEGSGGDGGHQKGEARLVFQEPCAPNTAHPSFFPDDTRFVHQHVSAKGRTGAVRKPDWGRAANCCSLQCASLAAQLKSNWGAVTACSRVVQHSLLAWG